MVGNRAVWPGVQAVRSRKEVVELVRVRAWMRVRMLVMQRDALLKKFKRHHQDHPNKLHQYRYPHQKK
jgi:hypothetical protein